MVNPKLRLMSYVRDLSVTTNKFSEFDRLIRDAWKHQADAVVVTSPRILGDTYEELTDNISKLASAELLLAIVPPAEFTAPSNNN